MELLKNEVCTVEKEKKKELDEDLTRLKTEINYISIFWHWFLFTWDEGLHLGTRSKEDGNSFDERRDIEGKTQDNLATSGG